MTELKPCPFCGLSPERFWTYDYKSRKTLQKYCCYKCGLAGDASEFTAEASEAWNRRINE